MQIWAHRGCSQNYPENTLLAFEKAVSLKKLTGIELDIQLTKDGELVVIHDEKVDRTTEGIGYVKDYTLAEIKRLHIYADINPVQQIPTMGEVLDLLEPHLKQGLKLNIELKNSVIPYSGMEEQIIDLVHSHCLQNSVIYSSFSALSLERIRKMDTEAEIGILDVKASDCLFKLQGGCGATALHPFWKSIDLPVERIKSYSVRAWLTGHLYPDKPTGTRLNLSILETQGITDVFLNEPERYLAEIN